MSHFKKILEIEKKYEHIVNTAQKHCENEFEKFRDEINMKEEASKLDYINELKRDFDRKIKSVQNQGNEMLKKSKDEAKYIYENANTKVAKKFLMEELKNV